MKVKETFKTIILTGLVISTLVLSSEIWLSEELWPEGYNSFLSGVFSIFKGNNADSLDLSQIYYPKQILVSKNERSKIVTTNDERYEELNNLLKGHIKTSLLSGEASTASSEEFKNACKENSLFIGLYSFISFEMLADYYGANVTSTVSDINHVKNILFCPLEDSSGFIMYVKNNESGKIFKISVSENIEKLQDMIDKILSRVNEGTVSASLSIWHSSCDG